MNRCLLIATKTLYNSISEEKYQTLLCSTVSGIVIPFLTDPNSTKCSIIIFGLVRQCPEVNLNGIIRNYALEYKALPGGSPQTNVVRITQTKTITLTTVQLLPVQSKRFSLIFC